jgi:hypothetical protein
MKCKCSETKFVEQRNCVGKSIGTQKIERADKPTHKEMTSEQLEQHHPDINQEFSEQEREYAVVAIQRWWRMLHPKRLRTAADKPGDGGGVNESVDFGHQRSVSGTFASHWFAYKGVNDPVEFASMTQNSARWSRRFSAKHGLLEDVAASVIQGLIRRHNAQARAVETAEQQRADASREAAETTLTVKQLEKEYAAFVIQSQWRMSRSANIAAPQERANYSTLWLEQHDGLPVGLQTGPAAPQAAAAGLHEDDAAKVIQGCFHRRQQQIVAKAALDALREKRRKENNTAIPSVLAPSFNAPVPFVSAGASTSMSHNDRADMYYTSGFQSNIAASIIQTLWRRHAATSDARQELKDTLSRNSNNNSNNNDNVISSDTNNKISSESANLADERIQLDRVALREVERRQLDSLIQREFELSQVAAEAFRSSQKETVINTTASNDLVEVIPTSAASSPLHQPLQQSSRRPPRPPSRDESALGSAAHSGKAGTIPMHSPPASRLQTPPLLPGSRPSSVLFSFRPSKHYKHIHHITHDGLRRVFVAAHDEEEGSFSRCQLSEKPWGFDENGSSLMASILGKGAAAAPQPAAKAQPHKTINQSPTRRTIATFSPNDSPTHTDLTFPSHHNGAHTSITSIPGLGSPSQSPLGGSPRSSPAGRRGSPLHQDLELQSTTRSMQHAPTSTSKPMAPNPTTTKPSNKVLPPQNVTGPSIFRGLRLLHDVIWELVRDIDVDAAAAQHQQPSHITGELLAEIPKNAILMSSVLAAANDQEDVEQTNEAEELRRVHQLLVGLRKGFTVVRWRNLKDVRTAGGGAVTSPLVATSTTSPLKLGQSSLALEASLLLTTNALSGVANRISADVLAAIPGEANLEQHVERFHKRHAEDAQRVQQQRREFRQERREELARLHRGPPSRGGGDRRRGGGDEIWDAANTYDNAFDVNEDSDAIAFARKSVGVVDSAQQHQQQQLPSGTTMADRVDAIYGDGWQYKTIIPRQEAQISTTSMSHYNHNASSRHSQGNDIGENSIGRSVKASVDEAVHESLKALHALNTRIAERGEQLRLSIKARKLSVKQRLTLLESLQHAEDPEGSDFVDDSSSRVLHQPPSKSPASIPRKKLNAFSPPPLPTLVFLESSRRVLPPAPSPTTLRAGTGAVSAPILGADIDDEPIPHRSASALGGNPPLVNPVLSLSSVKHFDGPTQIPIRGVKPKTLTPIAFSSPVPSMTSPTKHHHHQPLRTNRSSSTHQHADEALLQQFLSEDDSHDTARRAQLERKVMRETYFESIWKRHDRLQKIGGVSEDLIRRHPGWLVKGAKLMPLHLSTASSKKKQAVRE